MIDYTEFGRTAAENPDLRCVALVRHAERPPIDPADPTFGENLPLTDAGRRLALKCGRDLAKAGPPVPEWAFASSRLLRTRLTARSIAEGMGCAAPEVRVFEEVSIPGFWVADTAEMHRFQEAEGSIPFTTRFLAAGVAEGLRPIAESTRLAMEWIEGNPFASRLAIVATHDVFVASLMRGLGESRVCCDLWVGFLHAIALFGTPDGKWSFEWMVPDKNNWKSRFVQ
ncbi:MAG: histidine phosphatase family protein [Kiritimatiellae bacterium]|nr:histidine phosphatase family protein [Kiritimatiellia bacterium]